MTNKPGPCPFCGVEVERHDQPGLQGIMHPENDCLLGGELWTFDDLERWNRRVPEQEFVEALQGATELLVEYAGNRVDASVDHFLALLTKYTGEQS